MRAVLLQEFRSDGGMWHRLGWSQAQANAVHLDRPLTQFELVCELMVPLYAARCGGMAGRCCATRSFALHAEPWHGP